MNHLLSVLTPTYNRAHTLINCYKSLCNQTDKDFEWLIVDDGSTDQTKTLISNWQQQAKFTIRYIFKKNGGKHTALNIGFQHIDSELTIILDSDDLLTRDAVETIRNSWPAYRATKDLCGIAFLRGFDQNNVIGDKFPQDLFISNHIECRSNMNVSGDKSEVFLTSVLKEYLFPEIAGESFIGEGLAWNRMAQKYNMVYVNKIIYISEYLEGGLTKQGRRLRVRSPIGGMLHAKEALSPKYKLHIRLKNMLLYTCYGYFARKSLKFMINDSKYPLLLLVSLPVSYGLYRYWKTKYLT